MKSEKLVLFAVSLGFACPAALAAGAPQPVDPEIASNNVRYTSLMLDIKASYDWGTAKLSEPKFSRIKFYQKEKNLPLLTSNVNVMVSLVRQGKFTATTEFELKKIYASAIAEPMDLRYYTEAVAAYDEAIRLAPDDKARNNLVVAKARYELKAAQVDPAGPNKVLEDLYQSYSDAEKFAHMREFPGHDFNGPEGRALAEKLGADKLAAWYRQQVLVNPVNREDSLDVRNSFDYKLGLCDEAIAKLPKQADEFVRAKCTLYLAMKEFGPVEKVYREALAKVPEDKPGLRCERLNDLATLYVARAERYYADSDEKLTRQAIAFWNEAAKVFTAPENAKTCKLSGRLKAPDLFRQPATQAFLIRDYKLAAAWLDRYAQFLGEKAAKDPWICGCRGDLAYYAGDYAAAVKWYETPEKDFADGPTRIKYPNSHQRYAGALNALGEYEKCLKAVEKCPNPYRSSFGALNKFNRKVLEARLRARQGE